EEERLACRAKLSALRTGPIYTPPNVEETLQVPGPLGGIPWGGVSVDPTRRLLITNVNHQPFPFRLIPRAEEEGERRRSPRGLFSQEGTPYAVRLEPPVSGASGLPCVRPPWGKLVAVDAVTGEVRWQVPLGVEVAARGIPGAEAWGSHNMGGT